MTGLSLDVKLGLRMLAKYPGVTVVGVVALAIGVALGAAYLEIANDVLQPRLPFEEGDRIVGLVNWDVAESDPEPRSLLDFVTWRETLRAVQHVSAFRGVERNVSLPGVAGEPALGAELSASAFDVVRVPALLGRTLTAEDERAGAPPVVVLGYELWRARFGADAGIVGRTVQLDDAPVTVVGVMPEGFAFPVSHRFWVPLRVQASSLAPRAGPPVAIFGRLAPGVTPRQAQAELSAVGARMAAARPETHEQLRPRVVRYARLFVGSDGAAPAYLIEFLFVGLLLVLSANVATMIFARTATRENEITMRYALGASRRRILAQFFIEAFVLALIATVIGLFAVSRVTHYVTELLFRITDGRVPFWLDDRLNAGTIAFALLLAIIAALAAGVLPAWQATGARLQSRLRHPAGAGETGLRFGGLWSGIIVVQVCFAVIVLPPALVALQSLLQSDHTDPGFHEREYLSARVEMQLRETEGTAQADSASYVAFQAAVAELTRRLQARPEVTQVTRGSRLPGMDHPQPWVDVEAERGEPGAAAELVMAAAVGADFFDAFGARLLAGRAFLHTDTAARVIIVNDHFVREILHGRNAIGRRVRYTSRWGELQATGAPRGLTTARMREPGEWYEIVGVVSNLGMDTYRDAFFPGRGPGVYHPLSRAALGHDGAYTARIAFQVRGDAAAFAPRLRELAHGVHPALRLYDVLPLDRPVDRVNQSQRTLARFASVATAAVAVIALLISTAGIYSVLAFTVARQTREIGIRVALGAGRRRIILGVFSRAMLQIALGLAAGALLWGWFIVFELGGGDEFWLLLATGAVLTLVGLVACGVPVRRALRIAPADALRDIG